MTTLADITIPRRLKKRPLWHGMVVPITATIDAKGVPDFAVINDAVARRLIRDRACALCGDRIRGRFAFIGGGNAIANRLFRDGPMHEECARYAFAVCPFVSGRHREYRESTAREHALEVVRQGPIPPRPERMGLILTDRYETLPGSTIVHAGDPVEPVEWIE